MPLSGGRCYQRLAFGPSGVIAASIDGVVHLLDSKTGELIDSIEAHEGEPKREMPRACASAVRAAV